MPESRRKALVLTMTGSALWLGPAMASVVWGGCGVAAAIVAVVRRGPVLVLHAVIYVAGGAITSGLLTSATVAIARPPAEWLPLPESAHIALILATLVAVLPYRASPKPWEYLVRAPRALLIWLLTWVHMGVVTIVALGGAGIVEAPLLSTIRTTVLVAATLVVARAGRGEQFREAGWLMYPLLVLTGLKILFVDFPQGRPSTLFVALALYGVALIVSPRLRSPSVGGDLRTSANV